MPPDRDEDWQPRVRERKAESLRRSVPDMRAMHHAALSIAEVTGDEHWDRFLEIVQGRIEELRIERDKALDQLKTSDDYSVEGMINQKLAVRLFGISIEVLEWAVGLPKEILEKGERAKGLLGTVDETAH